MKPKAGLQKNVAFIFDGSAVSAPSAPTPAAVPVPVAAPAPLAPRMPSFVLSDAAEQTPAGPQSVAAVAEQPVAAHRPRPLPKKNQINTQRQTLDEIKSTVRRSLYGKGKKNLDAKQKKMAIMVAVLMVVLGLVLYMVLGTGPARAGAAQGEQAAAAVASSVQSVDKWKTPEPYPAALRDPMVYKTSSTVTAAQPEQPAQDFVVKGIVYSKTKPSVIVDGKVYFLQQTVNGATIVRIERDSVTFEKDGKQWQQQVAH